MAVLLQGNYRAKQFFNNELELVESVEEDLEALPAQNIQTEPEPQVIHVGDRVQIVSDRHGEDLVYDVGFVTVANNVGCVVKVAGKTLWFCIDEIVLASAAT